MTDFFPRPCTRPGAEVGPLLPAGRAVDAYHLEALTALIRQAPVVPAVGVPAVCDGRASRTGEGEDGDERGRERRRRFESSAFRRSAHSCAARGSSRGGARGKVIVVPRADEVVAEGLAVSARSRVDAHAVGAGAGGGPPYHVALASIHPSSSFSPAVRRSVRLCGTSSGSSPRAANSAGVIPSSAAAAWKSTRSASAARGRWDRPARGARGPEEAREPPGAPPLSGERRGGTRRGGGAVAAREGEDAAHAGG